MYIYKYISVAKFYWIVLFYATLIYNQKVFVQSYSDDYMVLKFKFNIFQFINYVLKFSSLITVFEFLLLFDINEFMF